jgi:hypothetical protein
MGFTLIVYAISSCFLRFIYSKSFRPCDERLDSVCFGRRTRCAFSTHTGCSDRVLTVVIVSLRSYLRCAILTVGDEDIAATVLSQ